MSMSSLKSSRRLVMALAAIFVLSLTLAATFVPLAEAAACTNGATRWVKIGCCACNHDTNKKLQACNGGVWVDTGYTQCFDTGQCCSFPCCV
jgi:hypothetical protein